VTIVPLERAQEAVELAQTDAAMKIAWHRTDATEGRRHRLRPDRPGDASALSARARRTFESRRCATSAAVCGACAGDYGVRARAPTGALLAMDVDAVLVLTSGSHAPIAIAAAEAGKHVLVEEADVLLGGRRT
jgi:predicted dehydrogenase